MKIPNNKQSRLADDVWLAGLAIAEHFGMTTSRDGFEMAVRDYVQRLAVTDPTFAERWQGIKTRHKENL